MEQKAKDNFEWQQLHYDCEHGDGFVHYYYELNALVGTKVIKDYREYSINLWDVMLLQYFIGYQKKENTCCFEKYSTIMDTLHIKRGTLLEALMKWKTLGVLIEKKMQTPKRLVTCRNYVNIPLVGKLLGYNIIPNGEQDDNKTKEIIKPKEEIKPYRPSYDEDENPFE
jgi:hypothetical protein